MSAVGITTSTVQKFELAHTETLRRLAPECMVLLKKNGDFPLSAPCAIALYGSGARRTIKGGTGSGDVNVRHFTSVEEGLENAGFTVTTKDWLDAYDQAKETGKDAFTDEIIAQAKREGKSAFMVGLGKVPPEPCYAFPIHGSGDTCIYVLGRISGEGSDRPGSKGDLLLSDDEVRDILTCAEKYDRFMLALNVGGVVDLSPVLDVVDNILLLSQLGTVTGDAFADVLLGKAYPSGKLTSTWARAADDAVKGDFAQRDDTRYREGVYVGYRWYDAVGIKPVFPFGYGLSYTELNAKAENFRVEDRTIKVDVRISNGGSFAGKETAQLYYSAPWGKLDKPLRELGAYAKTKELQPGESETLTLALPIENMASWDTDTSAWLLERGDYVISVNNEPVGIVTLDADAITERLSQVDGGADFEDWKPDMERSIPEGVPVIPIKAETLENAGHYDRDRYAGQVFKPIDLSDFTDEELALACIGRFKEVSGIAAIIGSSSSAVAGAAGETADVVAEKGFGKMILADGPAGLRVATRYIQTESGPEGLDNGSFEEYLPLLGEQITQFIRTKQDAVLEKAKTQPVYYHYASAIPIGTALAQAWDPEIPRMCGDLVGEEMELFGVNVWLAPALNIHRSPLCGRNFEYCSEDPLISGKTAAAITFGVQSHNNCAVTLKHFLCNNQETNRFNSNSIVSQRALREIYMKGFEVCVKESAPIGMMTSYNLLGGIHTANRRDILRDVLRREWGFTGFVMTDWSTTTTKLAPDNKYGASSAALCIKAGNDLIMPGCKADLDGILDGLADGSITRADLEECAGRVLSCSKRVSK